MTRLNTRITEREFDALCLANADRTSEKDYRPYHGPKIVFVKNEEGKVIAAGYYGEGPAGASGNHFYA